MYQENTKQTSIEIAANDTNSVARIIQNKNRNHNQFWSTFWQTGKKFGKNEPDDVNIIGVYDEEHQ